MSERVERPTSRVILIDPDGRVLLMGGSDNGRYLWLVPGGGCWPDEDFVTAACRELAEETGLQLPPERLGQPVARSSGEWTSSADTIYVASERYFAAIVDPFTPVADNHEPFEAAWFQQFRWWTPDDIEAASDQVIWPVGLAALVRRLAAGDWPAEPVDLPWE